MALDPVVNFAVVTVSQGYNDSATSIALTGGHGAKLPATHGYSMVWWNYTDYKNPSDDPNVEIVRVTARTTDSLTVTRAQESTSAATHNTADKVYKMILGITAKMITDITSTFVAKATYDAETILMAHEDNAPEALSVSEGTVVGRLAAGQIAALQASDLRTLLGITAAGAALVDDANAAAQLATLGLTATAAELNQLDNVTLGTMAAAATGDYIADAILTAHGDLIYATASATPAVLAHGAEGSILTIASSLPSWATHPNHIPATGASAQILQYTSSGAAKWITLSGDLTIADGGAITIGANKITLAMLATQAAQTVLANATGGAAVPAALALAEQTVLGRITGGSIVGLTATQIRTLINVADGANNYVHPTTNGNIHLPATGAANQIIQYASAGTGKWITLSGDVSIADNGAATIPVEAITYAKMQHVSATDKILGRSTAGAGDVEEIACTATGRSILDDTSTGAVLTTIGALPLAGGTMSGDITLGENTAIALDPAGSADEKWSGITVAGTAGETLAVGDLCYLQAAAGEWMLADADAAASAGPVVLGICVLAGGNGQATNLLLMGTVRSAAFPASIALGAAVYVSATAGDITATAPSTATQIVRIVGHAVTVEPNTIYFAPDNTWIEV